MEPTITPDLLDRVGRLVDISGIGAVPHDVIDQIVSTSSRNGISPVLIEVLDDETAPGPVRERALGHIGLAWHRRFTPATRTPIAA